MALTVIAEGNRRLVTVVCTVPDASGDLVDPDSVTFKVTKLDGVDAGTSYAYGVATEVVRDSLGSYTLTVDFDDPGHFAVSCATTGACKAQDQVEFVITPVA